MSHNNDDGEWSLVRKNNHAGKKNDHNGRSLSGGNGSKHTFPRRKLATSDTTAATYHPSHSKSYVGNYVGKNNERLSPQSWCFTFLKELADGPEIVAKIEALKLNERSADIQEITYWLLTNKKYNSFIMCLEKGFGNGKRALEHRESDQFNFLAGTMWLSADTPFETINNLVITIYEHHSSSPWNQFQTKYGAENSFISLQVWLKEKGNNERFVERLFRLAAVPKEIIKNDIRGICNKATINTIAKSVDQITHYMCIDTAYTVTAIINHFQGTPLPNSYAFNECLINVAILRTLIQLIINQPFLDNTMKQSILHPWFSSNGGVKSENVVKAIVQKTVPEDYIVLQENTNTNIIIMAIIGMLTNINVIAIEIVATICQKILGTDTYDKYMDASDENYRYKLVTVCIMHVIGYKGDIKKVPAMLLPHLEFCANNAKKGLRFSIKDILDNNATL